MAAPAASGSTAPWAALDPCPLPLPTPWWEQRARPDHATSIVLVDLDHLPAAPHTPPIERLRRNGHLVIAFRAGASSEPIQQRCRPLLAGAAAFLDSARDGFAAELADTVSDLLRNAREALLARTTLLESMHALGMVGTSERWLEIFTATRRVSQLSDLPVLFWGETGCGKELLVRAVHRLDPKRHSGPFVALNCGAISHELAESELFGHRRGAFSGADRNRPGAFRSAHGGVLFLDEVGELPPRIQEKLLRALQEGAVRPVGEDSEVPVDVRVLAATNRNLKTLVRAGTFREDLYHRLAVYTLQVPPLRERIADIRPLVLHFIHKHSTLAPAVQNARAEFLDALALTDLPGNARQLENLVRQAMINHTTGDALLLADLPRSVWQELSEPSLASPLPDTDDPADSTADRASVRGPVHLRITPSEDSFPPGVGTLAQDLDRYERILVLRALERANGNQSETARLLGITPRSVYNKLRKHSLAR